MNWQEVLTLLVPILGYMGWVYNRIEKRADQREKRSEESFKAFREETHAELREIRNELKSIDQRLTRLEGRFEERGYWESRRQRTGTEDQ